MKRMITILKSHPTALFLCLLFGGLSIAACSPGQTRTQSVDQKYYELVFIQVKDPKAFGEYGRKVFPIVKKYGGGLQRMLLPESVYGDGIKKPDLVNLVFYKNRAAYDAFHRDPEFLKIKPLRTKSIDMISIGAEKLEAGSSSSDLAGRYYMVELAYFKTAAGTRYQAYEAASRPVLGKYGYHLESKLAPIEVHGKLEKPDLLKVAFFNQTADLKRFEKDPRHKELETKLYPGAVRKSIWIMGKVHPMSLPRK